MTNGTYPKTRGGRREGAGRRAAGGVGRVKASVFVTPDALDLLRALAEVQRISKGEALERALNAAHNATFEGCESSL